MPNTMPVGSSPFWERPEADPGNESEERPAGAPQKPERWTEERRERVGVCTPQPKRPPDQNSPDPRTHARTPVRMRVHTTPHVAFPVLGDTAGYNDIEDESDNRNSMAWGRYTREENGESSLKRNINK